MLDPTALRKAKIAYNFDLSECSRVKTCLRRLDSRPTSAKNKQIHVDTDKAAQNKLLYLDLDFSPSSLLILSMIQLGQRKLCFFCSSRVKFKGVLVQRLRSDKALRL